jgi:histidinol-phosphate phosphatase family protein
MRQAVVLCGGIGVRLGSLVKDKPKPMLLVDGKPVLQHTIELLRASGITDIVLAAQYRWDVIRDYFADGARWGVNITISVEPSPLGTAGPLTLLRQRLDQDFLVIYGDVFVDFDLSAFIRAHQQKRPAGTLLVRQSDHPWDSHLIEIDDGGRVSAFIDRQEPDRAYRNIANAAVYALSRDILELIPCDRPSDFGQVFKCALSRGMALLTWMLEPGGFVKDMGTRDRLARVERYLHQKREIEAARGRRGPIRAVFLDRDGVLNREAGLICHPDEVHLLPGAGDAIRIFNQKGIKTVVVTNQPVVARGLCDQRGLQRIHEKLQCLLQAQGARLDAIYYCPHHPETHHREGVRELRRACDCRKPNIGMLTQAKEDLGLDLANCIIIGDRASDIEAGHRAGIRTVLLTREPTAPPGGQPPHYVFPALLDVARAIGDEGTIG